MINKRYFFPDTNQSSFLLIDEGFEQLIDEGLWFWSQPIPKPRNRKDEGSLAEEMKAEPEIQDLSLVFKLQNFTGKNFPSVLQVSWRQKSDNLKQHETFSRYKK